MTRRSKRNFFVIAVLLLIIVAISMWANLRREKPQPQWITADSRDNFLYGSIGAEREAGIPYWIWLALPRMFPEYMPGNGGYVSVGLPWEQGKEMPAGFSKKTVGYVRVAGNCAICHAASYRSEPDEGPEVVPVVPGRASDAQPLLTFFRQCAQDPRFNSTEIMTEINDATRLSWFDGLLYRYVLIPRTRLQLLSDSNVVLGPILRNHSTDPHSEASLSEPRFRELALWVKSAQVPQYPLEWNQSQAQIGRELFAQHCGTCHAKDGNRQGTEIPIAEIGTDRELANKLKLNGYVAHTLDGVWIRGPYLHNGAVASVGELMKPPKQRAVTFYQGNNLLNPKDLGFVSDLPQEKGLHFALFDTRQTGNSNAGHEYGTELSDRDKQAIIEYLKTL